MVLTPAPNSCRQDEAQNSNENWVQNYLPASTHRAKCLLPIGSLLLLGAIFPVGLTSHTPAPRAQSVQTQSVQTFSTQAKPAEAPGADAKAATPTTPTSAAAGASSSTVTTVTEETTVTASQPSTHIDPLATLPEQPGHQVRITAIVSGKATTDTVLLPLKGASVREALGHMGITLGQLDRVQPSASTAAYNGMTIRVSRVRADLEKRTQPIKAEVRYQPTASIARGTRETIQSGRNGVMEVTERVWSLDGKVTRREYVGKRVAQAPQHTIVALGTRAVYVPSRIPYHKRYARSYSLSARSGSPRDRFAAGNILKPLRSLIMHSTAYTPDPRENGGYNRTATGLPIGYGAVAVDPRVIPLGTKLYVEGYGYAFACDTGGAIKGNRIDLAVDTKRQAYLHGRRNVKVWILGR